MMRISQLTAAAVLLVLSTPFAALSDYTYTPGSAALQPLAVIEPVSPDSLFQTWTGDVDLAGNKNLGFSLDFLRNEQDTDDMDVFFKATGSFRVGSRYIVGITVPYIIRDPDFNESDLLDLRLFSRMKLLGSAPAFRVSGELSAIVPTAKEGTLYPFTLDSPVVGVRLAFAAGPPELRAGVNVGYQTYLATDSGKDIDLTYGAWMEKALKGPWKISGVYSSSTHKHTGTPGDDDVTDSYFQIGVRRAQSEKTDLGVAVGTGMGGDSVADLRVTASATFRFGEYRAPEKKETVKEPAEMEKTAVEGTKAPKTPPSPVYEGPVVVMIAEGIADSETEKLVTKVLQEKGFATGMDPDPGIKVKRKNILWYNAGMQEQAQRVSQTLVMGGHLEELEIRQSRKPIKRNWMVLVLGGEKK